MSELSPVSTKIDLLSLIIRVAAGLALINLVLIFSPLLHFGFLNNPSFEPYFVVLFWTLVLVPVGGACIQLFRYKTLGGRAIFYDVCSSLVPPVGYLGFLMYVGH